MASKLLKYSEEARRSLESGVDAVANAVKITLGPRVGTLLLRNLGEARQLQTMVSPLQRK